MEISSSSSARAADLPCSTWMEILGRLPIETLIHCRYVCRSWRSFLTDAYFFKLYSHHMATTLILRIKAFSLERLNQIWTIENYSPSARVRNTSGLTRKLCFIENESRPKNRDDLTQLLGPDFGVQLGNSCNGLVCVRERSTREPALVWNPIFGQILVLPKPDTISDEKVVAGFGFCGRTNRYKVLRIYHKSLDPPSLWRAEVYDLGVGVKWRQITDVSLPIPSKLPGFYINNCVHWILDDNNSKSGLIGCFDFMEESFKVVSPPPIFYGKSKYHWCNLGIISSCLSIGAIETEKFRGGVQVWVMEEYGVPESWTLRLSICDPTVNSWDPYMWIQVTNTVKSEEVLMLCAHQYLIAYSPRERRFWNFEKLHFPVIAHTPSFISLEDVVRAADKGEGSLNVFYL